MHIIRPVARLFKRGVHMCMGLITIMYSQQGLEYFLLLYYTISMYYCNMYNVLIIIKKPKLIKKQVCFLHSSRMFLKEYFANLIYMNFGFIVHMYQG